MTGNEHVAAIIGTVDRLANRSAQVKQHIATIVSHAEALDAQTAEMAARITRSDHHVLALESVIRKAGITIGAADTEETIAAIRSMYGRDGDLPKLEAQP